MPEIRHKAEIYVNYDEAQTRQNLSSGEEIRTVFGKIKKWFSDMGTAAFKNAPISGDAGDSEVVLGNDTRLSNARTPTAHNQASNTINAMTDYAKASTANAITTADTLNQAIGKLEKGLDNKANTSDIPTVNDGTLTIQQNGTNVATFTANQSGNSTANLTDTTYSAGDTMTLDNTTFDIGKRWTAVSKGQTWSRLFYSERKYISTGSSGILTLGATRSGFVCNFTFLIVASASTEASEWVKIIQLGANYYSTIQIRAITFGNGNYYLEIYDDGNGILPSTSQDWNCRYIPLIESNLTLYTSFTDGTTIPDNWHEVNRCTTVRGRNASAIRSITRSGNTFTATRQDGSTFTFDQNAALATNASVTLNGAITGTSSFSNNAVTINTKRKSCIVGNASGSTSATPYYKVASVRASLAAHQNYRLTLYVQQTINSNGAGFGILDIDIRTTASSLVVRMDSKWLISASGINPEDFILIHDKTAGSIDIYCKCSDNWKLYRFVVLSESNESGEADDSTAWTLYNDTTGIAELPTGDNIVIEYSSLADTHLSTARFKVEPNVAKTEVYMSSPNGDNGIYADVRDTITILQVACGQASNANGKVVFLGDRFYGGIGNPTSDYINHFKFNADCAGDSIGRAANSGAALSGSTLDLWYENVRINGNIVNAAQVWGLRADFENSTFTRLGNAVGLNAGSDFDNLKPWARRKCNVADDGTINAYYGDAGYTEDGSNGQVMVKQPKFYYKMVPVKLEEQSDGFGYHIRCADYYISDTPLQGYKVHPAFINEEGNEVDYYLTAAYNACIYDNSASDYLLLDEQVMDVNSDKLSSIAGAKPASGLSQDLTRAKFEQLAKNRGSGWHGSTIQIESAEQLLMIIELGGFNMQSLIASGVVDIPDQSDSNLSAITGSTASYGNGTGRASNSTVINTSGTSTTYTDADKTSICYRGRENPFGSIWQFVQGMLMWGDGHQKGGIPYICNDFSFNENPTVTPGSTNYNAVIDGYTNAGFTVANARGYISAFGYGNDVFDWLFIPSEVNGNSAGSSMPVGDFLWITQNLSGLRMALLGSLWGIGVLAGTFFWSLNNDVSTHLRAFGGRTANV